METKRKPRSVLRLATVFIALGFLLGGIASIFQSTPVEAEGGWQLDSVIFQDQKTVVVSDQDNDGFNDIFIWLDPKEFIVPAGANVSKLPEMIEWNKTAGCALISGKTGKIIELKKFSGVNLFIPSHQDFTLVFTEAEKIILLAVPVANYSERENPMKFLDMKSYQFVQIELSNLEIEKTVNITAQGWEPIEPFEDPTFTQFFYNPNVSYLRNMSIPVPGSAYEGDVIVLKNNAPFPGLEGYNGSKSIMTFIDPLTLQEIEQIEWNNNNPSGLSGYRSVNFGFCEGPTLDTEYNWKMPYFYITYYANPVANNAPYMISVASIDKLTDFFVGTDWSIYNKSITILQNVSEGSKILVDESAILSLNSTGSPVSITLLQRFMQTINNSIPLSVRKNYDAYFNWLRDEKLSIAEAYIVTSLNFKDKLNVVTTFQDMGRDEYSVGNTFNIQRVSNIGTCYNAFPIKISANSQETSVALMFMTNKILIEQLKGISYPVRKFSLIRLSEDAVGISTSLPANLYNLINGSESELVQLDTVVNPQFNSKIPVNYDLNEDGITDIPIPGTVFDKGLILQSENKLVNGPYFVVLGNSSLMQTHFYQIDGYQTSVFLSDIDGDGVSDAFLNDRIMIYGRVLEPEVLGFLATRLQNPNARIWLILGLILFVLFIIVIIYSITLRKSGDMLYPMNKKIVSFFFILALGLIGLLYYLQNEIVNATKLDAGTLIGSSSGVQAIQSMIQASTLANFVFLAALPITLGLFIMSSPKLSENIVSLNPISSISTRSQQLSRFQIQILQFT